MTANPIQRLREVVLLILAVLAFGTGGYRVITGISWLDSLYFTVITMSTVGYREVTELGPGGKIFTILLIVLGAGLVAYSLAITIEIFVDEQTRNYFILLLNSRRSKKMNDHYIVCGLGRVGIAVCEELRAAEAPFVVIDMDAKKAQQAAAKGWLTIQGDATEDRIMEQANIATAKGLIACVDTDATNMFVVVSAKALRPEIDVSVRVHDESHVKKFERAGATHVYSPYSLLGRRIARSVTRPRVLELLDLALEQTNYDLTIEEVTVSDRSPLAWLSLKDSGIRQNFGGVVLSIIRADREILHNPDPEVSCQPGDILITLGTPEQLRKMREIVEMK